ncbi:aspartate/glutamate racemase family protein [Xylophilus sp. ASV27]|uniref:aspartate/glutamate racemase family protein n=1 Tax=Xylophilus sp. ASV27 TaxID=2795129 RepID=UPI00351BF9F4
MPAAHPEVVGILGGMGPAAGADFVRLFVQACIRRMEAMGLPVHDQGFPEHWLAQVPVPDRSRALADATPGAHQPLDAMLMALGRLAALGARAVAIACNTAHAWHAPLQQRFPQIELLHMADETAAHLRQRGVAEAVLLATQGTYDSGVYDAALERAGVACHRPAPAERAAVMQGIYAGVKAGDLALARECFGGVARAVAQRHPGSALIMGCTEIPLALPRPAADAAGLLLVDPAEVLAAALARKAYACVTSRA